VPAAFCFARAVPLRLAILLFLSVRFAAAQEVLVIPAEELGRAPTAARVTVLVDRAAAQGWGSVTPALRTAAMQAYATGSGYVPAWYYLYRWADLLGTPYNKALQDWVKAVEKAGVAHQNMPARYEYRPGSLSAHAPRELQLALLGNAVMSEEFFTLLAPVDNPAEVLTVLQKVHTAEPALWAEYGSLALALAVVYDTPPSPYWPHGQVDDRVLPRRLPAPEKIFAYLARLDRTNVSLHRLRRLPAGELKFLVDLAVPFTELDWARQNVPPGLADLGKAYDLIKYRKDRIEKGQFIWPGPDYRLATILQQGGICVDQAYFASTAGKAKGIPTIMFRGAGLDGRHAWFGYLDANQKWQLDCGRYAEQKFVVGLAYDPQTWGNINDHELGFITERFRALPTYKLSVMHAAFAGEYLRDSQPDMALKAAREAVNRDRRNLNAWGILLQAQAAASPDQRAQENILREAVLAFKKYPDLEIAFSRQLVTVLRQRGESSVADFEEQRLGKKYQSTRVDLSVQQAAGTVERSMKSDDVATQIKVYNRILDTAGQGQAIDFYDKVVTPFVTHLAEQGQVPAALQCLDRARRTLRVEPGRQLDREMTALAAQVKMGKK
jgi:tetratricopeptide (TPR) repeat protein